MLAGNRNYLSYLSGFVIADAECLGGGSEFELHVELHAARRLGCDRSSEQGRRNGPDVGDVVGMVENIERIQRNRNDLGLFLLREWKIVRDVEVEIDRSGAGHGIASNTAGTVVENAIMIIVAAGRDIHRLAGVKRQRQAQREKSGRLG